MMNTTLTFTIGELLQPGFENTKSAMSKAERVASDRAFAKAIKTCEPETFGKRK